MRHRRRLTLFFTLLAIAACGSRTALIVTENDDAGILDAGRDVREAGRDVRDVGTEEALPMIDASKPDVPPPNDCPDAASTLVYLIGSDNTLLSFYPPTLQFKTIGKIACPNTNGATPFSMGVDRKGTAYVVFTNGALYKVSTLTAACLATAFKPGPMSGFDDFGMGFAGDNVSEELYVAGSGTPSAGLATIDTMSFQFKFINVFVPDLDRTELTGTGDGRLFGWSPDSNGPTGSTLTQIDRKTAKLIGANKLAVGTPQVAFAFAFWGGDFYIFTGEGPPSTVTKYDPGTLKETNVATAPNNVLIVGAGVSTCAPSQ